MRKSAPRRVPYPIEDELRKSTLASLRQIEHALRDAVVLIPSPNAARIIVQREAENLARIRDILSD